MRTQRFVRAAFYLAAAATIIAGPLLVVGWVESWPM